jgi:DUF4097 and DUF4098 domain-containing protein YvlB
MKKRNNFSFASPLFALLLFFTASVVYSNGHDLLKEVSIPSDGAKNVIINSFSGNVFITGNSSVSDVTMRVYGRSRDVNDIVLETGRSASTIVVDCKKSESAGPGTDEDYDLRIVVDIPRKLDVSSKTGNGNLSVSNIEGKLRIYSGGGNLTMSDITSDIYAVTGGGNVSAENSGGLVNIISGGGNIDVINFSSMVIALTDGGNVTLKGSNAPVNASTGGGNIVLDYSGTNYGMVLNSGSGNIKVEVPQDFEADVNLFTESGRISGDLPVEKNKKLVREAINGGGKKLYCLTETGNIILNLKRT